MENVKMIMEFITGNSAMIIGFICVVIYIGEKVWTFIGLPTEGKKKEIKKILLAWVSEAEASWGSGTGEIKFSEVYAKFVEAYPYVKKWISQATFEEWVKEAMEQMKKNLANNPAAFPKTIKK